MSSATPRDILEAAKKKHAAYNKWFHAREYRFVYKDGSSSRNDINIKTILQLPVCLSQLQSLSTLREVVPLAQKFFLLFIKSWSR